MLLGSVLSQLDSECSECEFIHVTFSPANRTKPVKLELLYPDGEEVAVLFIPSDLSNQQSTTLAITYVRNVPNSFSDQELGGTILDITLEDLGGSAVTELDAPLVICFERPKNDSFQNRDVCLSYFDLKKEKWVCEDECLLLTDKEDQLCGTTDHLTNFALLLNGKGKSNADLCHSNQDLTLAWISMGMVAGAMLIISLCVIALEVHTQRGLHRKRVLLALLKRSAHLGEL